MVMMTAAIRMRLVPSRPGFQHRGRPSGFGTQGNFQSFLEKEWMIKNSETVSPVSRVSPVKRQWRLKNSKRILRAEKGGDIHVNARIRLVVEIKSDLDANVIRRAGPDVHVFAAKATGAHGVKDHTLAIGIRVYREIIPVEIVARAVIGTELMSLHPGAQDGQRIQSVGSGFDLIHLLTGKSGFRERNRKACHDKNSKNEFSTHASIHSYEKRERIGERQERKRNFIGAKQGCPYSRT